ncbi:MAG TPA: cytochrome c-type biogenesis protein [Gemmatimonadaceae bacterium]|nr:cytochrome c-type biogenesis protein [Gemmatimonadaceae bacterium]
MKRREFLRVAAAGVASAALPGVLGAQQANTGAANVPMNEQKYKPVRLPAKSSTPSMSTDAMDELEHHIHCMCGCNLDIFTCRTTDFTCPVSPAMHRDVMALVNGGHSAQEIIDAFVDVYGERVLMEPKKTGFNLTGYITPFAALGGGAALIVALLRRWHRPQAEPAAVTKLPVEGTSEEMERLNELLHRDDR